jgi:hypothetical protein
MPFFNHKLIKLTREKMEALTPTLETVEQVDALLEPVLDRLNDDDRRTDEGDLEEARALTIRRNELTKDQPITVPLCPPDRVPKPGEWIYVRTAMSIGHGWDDVVGGLAQVTEAKPMMSGGDPNVHFVATRQHSVRGGENWEQHAAEEQEKRRERYGNQWAYVDPDWRVL